MRSAIYVGWARSGGRVCLVEGVSAAQGPRRHPRPGSLPQSQQVLLVFFEPFLHLTDDLYEFPLPLTSGRSGTR